MSIDHGEGVLKVVEHERELSALVIGKVVDKGLDGRMRGVDLVAELFAIDRERPT